MHVEPLLSSLMKHEDWRWFRCPFVAEGDTPEKKAALRDILRERGYKIAAVTMSFGDYLWNEPYARCKVKGDAAAIKTLEKTYLSAAARTSITIEAFRTLCISAIFLTCCSCM